MSDPQTPDETQAVIVQYRSPEALARQIVELRTRALFAEQALVACQQERDAEWKHGINHQQQPTLCDGSDQIGPLTPHETIAVVHAHVVAVQDALVAQLRTERATLEQDITDRANAENERIYALLEADKAKLQKQLQFARADVAEESVALDDAVEQFEKDKAELRARIVALEARLAARTPAT